MLAAWMFFTVLVSAAVGAAAWLGERALEELGAPTRWAWAAGLGLALAIMAVGPVIGSPAASPASVPGAIDGSAASSGGILRMAPVEIPEGGLLDRFGMPLAAGWAGLVGMLLLRSATGAIRLRRRMRNWRPVRLEEGEVLVSVGTGPAVCGVFRPRVVLPEWCLELPARERTLILAHEEEHRKAGDALLVAVARAVAVLLPWNPLMWAMLSRLRTAVEVDCDARVTRVRHGDRRTYGELLLRLGAAGSDPAAALSRFADGPSTLGRRIHMLTRGAAGPRLPRTIALGSAGLVLVAVACLVPGPDRASFIVGPDEADSPQLSSELRAAPQFTPYTAAPEVRNRDEVTRALQREYPPLARDAGIGGEARVQVLVDEAGAVRERVLSRGSGHAALDDAALRVAEVFAFSPAIHFDRTVPVWIELPITFGSPAPEAPSAVEEAPAAGSEALAAGSEAPAGPSGSRAAERVDGSAADSRASGPGSGPTFTPYTVAPEVTNRPEVLRALELEYPPALRDAGIGGTVMMHLFIEADGSLEAVLVDRGSGHAALDQAAMRVAHTFRFSPAMNRDQRVPVWIQLPITFTTR